MTATQELVDSHEKPVLSREDDDRKKFLVSFSSHGQGAEATVKAYNSSSGPKMYEDSAIAVKYTAPDYAADMIAGLLRNADKGTVKILDLCAGTGQIGEKLKEAGFTDITAVDGSQAMLDECMKKGIYSNHVQCLLSGETELPFPDGHFDLVVTAAGFIPDHIPAKNFTSVPRVVRKGGYIINSWRQEHKTWDYGKELLSIINKLKENNVLKEYGQLLYPKYDIYVDGVLDIYMVE